MKRRIFSGVLVVGVILCCLSACNKKTLTFIDGSVMEKTRFSSDVVYDSDSAGRPKGGNFSFVNITAETGAISGDAYTIGDGESLFSFVITWADSGNPIYVGLFDAGNGETYVIRLFRAAATMLLYSIRENMRPKLQAPFHIASSNG